MLLGIYTNEVKTDISTKTCVWMLIASLWKQPRCLSLVECKTNRGTSTQWNIIQWYKDMSHQATKRQEGPFSAYCWVKEASLKRYILSDFNYKTFWKRQTKEVTKRLAIVRGSGGRGKEEGWTSGKQGMFWTVKLFCMRLKWCVDDIIHFSKPTDLYKKVWALM